MGMRNVNDSSIRTKLMTICILLVAIPVIVRGYASYNAAKAGMNDESDVMLQQQALIVKGEVASVSEESSSSVQDPTSAIQELTSEAQGLSDIANELADELNRFKVNA